MTTPHPPGASTPHVVTIADGRATVRLNRPREHNRIEPGDLAVLRETFDHIDRDPDIRVLVLTGTGKSFSSGYHIGALVERKAARPGPGQADDTFETVVNRLEALRVPTIAALQGSVYGGATDLALACDFRIGVAGMRMLMPAARLGIIYYPGGIERYVSRLGIAAAKRLFLTAEPIEAEEMQRIGYLDEIVPADELSAGRRARRVARANARWRSPASSGRSTRPPPAARSRRARRPRARAPPTAALRETVSRGAQASSGATRMFRDAW